MSTIRVEPFTVGDCIHVYNRGNKKAAIFLDKSDHWRFLRSLRFFNDIRDIDEFAKGLSDLVDQQESILRKSRGSDPREMNRLSTIRKMDRIIVMDGGTIAEEGTHETLIRKRNGIYKQLWSLQAGGFIK